MKYLTLSFFKTYFYKMKTVTNVLNIFKNWPENSWRKRLALRTIVAISCVHL